MLYLKYYGGLLLFIPAIPFLMWHAYRIKKQVPILPEAGDTEGSIGKGDKKIHLLSIGESTIAGVGVSSQRDGITGTLANLLHEHTHKKIIWKVVARSGYTALRVNNQLLNDIGNFQPDIILIGLGGNDAFKLSGLGKWKRDMTLLLNNIRYKFPDTPIALTNMPPIKDFPAFTPLIKFFLGNLVEFQTPVLKTVTDPLPNVFFNDEFISLKMWYKRYPSELPPEAYFSDGVHPSKITYQTWAKEMFTFMQQEGMLKQFKN